MLKDRDLKSRTFFLHFWQISKIGFPETNEVRRGKAASYTPHTELPGLVAAGREQAQPQGLPRPPDMKVGNPASWSSLSSPVSFKYSLDSPSSEI